MGKQIVTTKQSKGSQNQLFPQSIAVTGLAPLHKVWVDYEPPPKNRFDVRVNGQSFYSLALEEIDFDPS